MVFNKLLVGKKYVSDGDENTIVIKESDVSKVNNSNNLKLITY